MDTLEELHDTLVPENNVKNLNESGEQSLKSTCPRLPSTDGILVLATIRGMALLYPLPSPVLSRRHTEPQLSEDVQPAYSETQEICSLRGREGPVDGNKWVIPEAFLTQQWQYT
jgi:hypothetical protein